LSRIGVSNQEAGRTVIEESDVLHPGRLRHPVLLAEVAAVHLPGVSRKRN